MVRLVALVALVFALQVGVAEAATVGNGTSGASRDQVPVFTCTDIFLTAQNGSQPCRTSFGRITNGTQVTMQCWLDDQPLIKKPYSPRYPQRSPRWFYVSGSGLNGWVHSYYVPQQDRVGACSRSRLAVNWAAKQRGSHTAAPDVTAWFSDWVPGPAGEWSFDCAKFAFSAYRKAGKDVARGDAVVMSRAYKLKGGTPPPGALVFWPKLTKFGHVAIADGNGGIFTTAGKEGSYTPIKRVSLASYPASAGWIIP